MAEEMERFKERMKELYIEDMIRGGSGNKHEEEYSRNTSSGSRSDYPEMFYVDEKHYEGRSLKMLINYEGY